MAQSKADNLTIIFDDFEKINDNTRLKSDLSPADIKKKLEKEAQEAAAVIERNNSEAQRLSEEMKNSPEKKSEIIEKLSTIKKSNALLSSKIKNKNEVFEKNPEAYTNLYNLKERMSARQADAKIKMTVDKNKELMLVIDRMQPSPFSFIIKDGKLSFTNNDINKEQVKELLSSLELAGIKNFKLPDELDKKLKETIQTAQQEKLAEESVGYEKDPLGPQTILSPDTEQEGEKALAQSAPSALVEDTELPSVQPITLPSKNKTSTKEEQKTKISFEEACRRMREDILTNGMGKKKGLSFFEREKDGWNAWYVFDDESPNNMESDGSVDSKGNVKTKHSSIFWLREDGKGGFEAAYSMPKDKKVDDNTADRLVGLMKTAGYTHIKFSGITDGDKGVFRTMCAAYGVIPVGIGFNEHQAADMVRKAEEKLSEEDAQLFKWRLAQQMRKNAANGEKGVDISKHRTYGYIKELEGNYNFKPFRNAYDGSFKPLMEKEIRGGKAENVIGSASAISRIFDAYRGGEIDDSEVKLEFVMNPSNNFFSAEEVNAIKAKFAENGLDFNPDTQMRNLSAAQLTSIYEVLLPLEIKKAGESVKEEISSPDMTTKERKDTVNDFVSKAYSSIQNICGDLDAKGVKGTRVPNRQGKCQLSAEYWPQKPQQPKEAEQNNSSENRRGGYAPSPRSRDGRS